MCGRFLVFMLFVFAAIPVFADNKPVKNNDELCAKYKTTPEVTLKKTEQKITIKESSDDIWPRAGFVEIQPYSTFAPQMGYTYNHKYFCVYLVSVDATVGFDDFEITVDKKYKPESCEYKVILEHENQHIKDSKKALDNVFPKIEEALKNAANAVMPVYVEDADSVPYAFDQITDQLKNDKKLKELVDEFKEQETRDADALDNTPDTQMMKCVQDSVDAAFEKYYKKKKTK